jgi:hypothetical protein
MRHRDPTEPWKKGSGAGVSSGMGQLVNLRRTGGAWGRAVQSWGHLGENN